MPTRRDSRGRFAPGGRKAAIRSAKSQALKHAIVRAWRPGNKSARIHLATRLRTLRAAKQRPAAARLRQAFKIRALRSAFPFKSHMGRRARAEFRSSYWIGARPGSTR